MNSFLSNSIRFHPSPFLSTLSIAILTIWDRHRQDLLTDNGVIFQLEKKCSERNHEIKGKLFLSTGSYEEEYSFAPFYDKFIDQLKLSSYKVLEIESMTIDKMGHGSEGY